MVVNAQEFGLPEDRRMPTTTLEGWRRFVDEDPIVFDLLPEDEWKDLDPRVRDEYDEGRVNYHSELITCPLDRGGALLPHPAQPPVADTQRTPDPRPPGDAGRSHAKAQCSPWSRRRRPQALRGLRQLVGGRR